MYSWTNKERVCFCAYTDAYVHMWVHMCRYVCTGQRLTLGIFLMILHLIFWDEVCSLNLELINSAKCSGQQTSGILLLLLPQCWDKRCTWIFTWGMCWGSGHKFSCLHSKQFTESAIPPAPPKCTSSVMLFGYKYNFLIYATTQVNFKGILNKKKSQI